MTTSTCAKGFPFIFQTIVENSESSYVVNYDKMETEAKELPSCTLSENEILHTENPSPIAIILYTSGSTGVPKGDYEEVSVTQTPYTSKFIDINFKTFST